MLTTPTISELAEDQAFAERHLPGGRCLSFDEGGRFRAAIRSAYKAREAQLPEDERRGVWTADGFRDYPIERLVQAGQVAQTHRWTRWDRIRWALPWLLLGLALGALTDLAVRLLT